MKEMNVSLMNGFLLSPVNEMYNLLGPLSYKKFQLSKLVTKSVQTCIQTFLFSSLPSRGDK